MTNFEKIKSYSFEELTDFLATIGNDDAPWYEMFSKKYCANCPVEKVRSAYDNYEHEHEACYCELNKKCRYFPDISYDEVMSDTFMTKLWLEDSD